MEAFKVVLKPFVVVATTASLAFLIVTVNSLSLVVELSPVKLRVNFEATLAWGNLK